MAVLSQTGYLETAYLQDYPYLSGQINEGIGFQVDMQLVTEDSNSQQVEMIVNKSIPVSFQVEMFINAQKFIGQQTNMFIDSPDDDRYLGMQSQMLLNEPGTATGFQVELTFPDSLKLTGLQVEALINDQLNPLGMQAELTFPDTLKPNGMQVKIFPLAHWQCEKYLNNAPYLTDSYLAGCFRAFLGMQTKMFIDSPDDDRYLGMQTEMKIDDQKDIGMQTEMKVETVKELGMQAEMVIFKQVDIGMQTEMTIEAEKNIGQQAYLIIQDEKNIGQQILMLRREQVSSQATLVIYNTEQLRILCTFASRGTPALGGTNWTSIQPIAPGDFSPNNLNTDILEQRTQTDGIVALWELRCDTGIPQGAFVDTIAILEHNFTTSARVTFQGTNDPTWSTVGQNIVMVTEIDNMYYIAPELPTLSFRYNRFIIEDFTNPDGYLRIGTIIFGSSNIFSKKECFTIPVTFGEKHFKDSIQTEGFTNVSNDRATRKFLGLNFEDLRFDGGNYSLLKNYFSYAKTDLKCLIIPRPTRPSSLAVFAKLIELPEESHRAIADDEHYVSFGLEWDESL